METEAVFAAAVAERRAFIDLIEGLDEGGLATPSLCAGWDARTVAGHLLAAISGAKGPLVVAMIRSGGSLSRTNDRLARANAARPKADLVAALRANATSRFVPPIVGPRAPLADVLIHGGDVRVPLGVEHTPDPAALRCALEFVTTGRPVAFLRPKTIAGLHLSAEDIGWNYGEGAELRGRGLDLLMAVCGRTALLERLDGDGVAMLAERQAA